jgi:hypothetical protein
MDMLKYSRMLKYPRMLEFPRIGNRSDALELLEKIIEEFGEGACYSDKIGIALEALKDAIEREVL